MKLFTTLLSFIFVISLNAQNIYDWRGVDRTGVFNETNLLKEWPIEGPELLWEDTTIGLGYTSPLADENHIFVAGMIDSTGYIYCFDQKGTKVWELAYGKEWHESFPGSRSNLIKKDNSLYFLSGFGKALKVDASNGKIIWSVNLIEAFEAPLPVFGLSETALLINDMVLFTPGGKYTMVALKQSDGSLVWKSSGKHDDISGYCSARLIKHNGRKIIIQQTQFNLWGIDYENGDSLWSYNIKNKYTDNSNPPFYFDSKVLISSPYGNGSFLFQLNEKGTQVDTLWRNPELDIQSGAFVVIDNHMYGASISKKKWYCIDLNTGKTKWTSRKFKIGSIIYAEGLIYMYSDMGHVALVEPNSTELRIISQFRPFEGKQLFAHPAIKNGKLYLRANNRLKVFNISNDF